MENNLEGQICSKCKIFQSFEEFYKEPRKKNGYGSNCKKCYIERKKENQLRNRTNGVIIISQQCCRCKEIKNKDKFYIDNKTKNGLRNYCIDCEKLDSANRYEQKLLGYAKVRAKEKGIEINIKKKDIKIPEICPVLNIKLDRLPGDRRPKYNSPSLDRINPNKGYIKGNIRVISWRANSLKSNGTYEELIKVAEDVRKIEESFKTNE